MTDKVSQRQDAQKRFHDTVSVNEREFTEGQCVLVENLRGTMPKWITGKIVGRMGSLSYKVEIDGVVHRCHIDQLLPAKGNLSISNKNSNTDDGVFMPTPAKGSNAPEPTIPPAPRHNPPRNR